MVELFRDGQVGTIMETLGNFTAWTLTNGGCAVVAAPVHHGVNAAQFTGWGPYLQIDLADIDGMYARVFARVPSLLLANGSQNNFIHLRRLSDNYDVCYAGRNRVAGVDYFCITYRDNTAAWITDISAVQCAIDRYYCVKLKWTKNTLGGCQLWIDGVLAVTATGTTLNCDVGRVRVGNPDNWEANTQFIDCVLIADTDPGCEISAPKGTIAVHAKLAGII